MTIEEIAEITSGKLLSTGRRNVVKHLLFDSRRPLMNPSTSLFFAIKGNYHDGHSYLPDLHLRGVHMFIVETGIENTPDDSWVIKVDDAIEALQQVASRNRDQFSGEVVGITGSNGKTIVKEWIYQLLSPHMHVVKSPSSYNSQLGVPLSVWQLLPEHEIGLFEAGISQTCEMQALQKVIQPTIGIFTNIGSAHDEGFKDRTEKIQEKMQLFAGSEVLIYCRDHEDIHEQVNLPAFSWGRHEQSHLRILQERNAAAGIHLTCFFKGDELHLRIPFADHASLENAMHTVACLLHLGFTADQISEGLSRVRPLRMRLELKQGRHDCYLIDDTYNNDLAGLRNALDFLSNVSQKKRKSLILSDILQSGLEYSALVGEISTMIRAADIHRFIGIGPVLTAHKDQLPEGGLFYESTEEFLADGQASMFQDEVILIKGARPFQFERIIQRIEEKVHGTVLEVDLGALTNNLNHFRSKLNKGVKVMVMVKAFAYGSGSLEVANLLQYHRVDYLGVAYADEGIFLRRNGIRLPIMVMNPTPESFENMLANDLEPEIYSPEILHELISSIQGRKISIHLKLDTGMHRLGFEVEQLPDLLTKLRGYPELVVKSIFTHLAAAETEEHEEFSRHQAMLFKEMTDKLMPALKEKPLLHLLNSSGIIRYPAYQFDMVRLGIGLYGIEGNNREQDRLQQISTLRTIISQVKEIKAGESVGYGRKGNVDRPMRIATIAIGYADGFSRILSNGQGRVYINGMIAPVIGNVCMDMTMIDITGVDAKEGDMVEIFGPNIPLNEFAEMSETIPYEILTNVSQRVKRVFFSD